MNNDLSVGSIFCDQEKASDCVDYSILFDKLQFYGIVGKFQSLIKVYLNGRRQRVLIDNIQANAVKTWVLQGSILGPLVFIFNINLPKAAKNTTTVLCADDTSVTATNPSTKIVSNILLSRLIPYAEEIIGDYQCGFQRSGSSSDHIFCIRQVIEKKWEYSESVHQLFIDFRKAYDSVRREILCNTRNEFGFPM